MNEIWANRLIAGTRTWKEVPKSRQEAVKEILQRRLENEEQLNKIIKEEE